MKKVLYVLVILSMVSFLSSPASATSSDWINTGVTSASWGNTDNWSAFTIPGALTGTTNTDTATFNSALGNYGTDSVPIIIDSGRNIQNISFDTSADNYFIGDTGLNPLILTSGGTIGILSTLTSTNAIETINAPLDLPGAYTFSNNSANGAVAGAGTLNIGGTISGESGATILTLGGSNTNLNNISGVIADGSASSVGITKTGAGTWELSGSNTYTGTTTVSAGTLIAANTQALGNATATLVLGGGTLDLATDSSITSYDTTITADSTIISDLATSGAGITHALGTLSIGAYTLNLSAGSNVTSGTAGLTFGATTLTATGATFIANSGTLLTLGTFSDGGSGYSFTIDGEGNTEIIGVIGTESGSLTKNGTGTLTLSAANSFSGGITISNGTLAIPTINNISTNGTLGNNTSVTLGGSSTTGTLEYTGTDATPSSTMPFTLAAGGSGAFQIDNSTTDLTLSGLISSSGSLSKTGAGTLTLSHANTYSGTTDINAGTLQLGNPGAIPSGSDVSIADGATLDLNGNSAVIGSLASSAGTISGEGAVTNNASSAPATLTAGGDNNSTTFDGDIVDGSSPVGLIKAGTGTLTLNGSNTYSGTTTISGGVLQIGNGSTTGSLGTGNVTDNANLTFDLSASPTIANIISGTGSLTQNGPGTITLSAANTYTGVTTLNAGAINLGTTETVGTSGPLGDSAASNPGSIVLNGGYLEYSGANENDYSGRFSTASNQQYNVNTGLGESVTWGAALTSLGGSLTKIGAGTLILTGANTYYGGTTVDGGTLTVGPGGSLGGANGSVYGPLSVNNTSAGSNSSVVLNLSTSGATTTGSLSGVISEPGNNNTVTINNGGSGHNFIVNQTANGTYAGVIAGNGSFTLGNFSTSTLTLSGENTYSGGTAINAGKLQVENSNALGTSAVINNATLNLDTTNLSIGNTYTQNSSSALYLTAGSASLYGKITTAVAASIDPGSLIHVTVGYNIPNNTTFDIINTQGAGITTSTPGNTPTVGSTSSLISFTSSISGNDLILTADNPGFASLANNANARAVGAALDHITNPSSDMSNVIGTIVNLSNSKISSALNTLGPIVDGGVIENSSASINNFMGASLDRVQDILSRNNAINSAIDKIKNSTGVSSGDESEIQGIWAKPYGSYLNQGTRDGIQGYDAWNAGTAIGYDLMVSDNLTVGVSGGYAYGKVNSDANYANTDINSAQGTIYAGYQNPDLNYFIDAAGSFAWNWYDGQRDIAVGNINRTADSNFNGQQYGVYLEGGYNLQWEDGPRFTPLASLEYTYLSLDSYAETNANALDLNVDSQGYSFLESGLGISISYPKHYDWGNFTPELHTKWLYDFINDNMSVTSTFTGGGGSFTSNGSDPSRNAADIGAKLSFDLNNDLSLIATFDTELRDRFFGVYGSGTVHYKF